MKLFLVVFAVIAAVAADVSHLPSNEYLPPQQEAAPAPTNEYLPPVQEAPVAAEPAPAHELADDGYRYKTHRRVVYRRNRRDVSHLPSNEYLPPAQEAQVVEAAAPVEQYAAPVEEAAPAHELADDGYRYKTHRRVVYRRNRRDVSNEYLPPVQEQQSVEIVEEPVVVNVQEEAAPAHELADDGYRYKTHRRVVYRRNRRDVSHLPSNEYLPPQEEAAPAPTNEYLPPVQEQQEAAPAHELADDGYRYKTHRRVVYRRNRRDVSHLPSNEYLPPAQEAQVVEAAAPVEQYAAPVEEAAPAHELADDGYRYKTHRRVVYRRNRRDVSHLPSNEYLPPAQEAQTVEVAAPVEQYAAPVEEAAPAHELADDGYRYKTHRRVVYRRNRRDVSHLPSNEYLPPAQEAQAVEAAAPAVEYAVAEEAAPAHELADDGYRYKTHRRVVYRRNRRDVSNEYLPPVQEAQVAEAPVEQYAAAAEEAAPAHELADDGYRYKTHRRVVYRRNRRDVSNEYLPPVQEAQAAAPAPVAAPTNEYLPPVQQQEAAPAHELADDGYRYKTLRRVVYRRH
ncbi:uncharacterized protein LOC142235009 [Haematobia irritans]|uniref:uncharacterized protein LOC142235009 n=1 Tax=Haematobia irritans TaxID=7368 RepID=UPI003F4F625B